MWRRMLLSMCYYQYWRTVLLSSWIRIKCARGNPVCWYANWYIMYRVLVHESIWKYEVKCYLFWACLCCQQQCHYWLTDIASKCTCIMHIILLLSLLDINECDRTPCDQTCTNIDGSFECNCVIGYRLQDNKRSCIGKLCVCAIKWL